MFFYILGYDNISNFEIPSFIISIWCLCHILILLLPRNRHLIYRLFWGAPQNRQVIYRISPKPASEILTVLRSSPKQSKIPVTAHFVLENLPKTGRWHIYIYIYIYIYINKLKDIDILYQECRNLKEVMTYLIICNLARNFLFIYIHTYKESLDILYQKCRNLKEVMTYLIVRILAQNLLFIYMLSRPAVTYD